MKIKRKSIVVSDCPNKSYFIGTPVKLYGMVVGEVISAQVGNRPKEFELEYVADIDKKFAQSVTDSDSVTCPLNFEYKVDGKEKAKPFSEARIKIILSLAYDFVYVEYMTSMLSLRKPKFCNLDISRGNQIVVMNISMKDYKEYDAILLTEWDHEFKPDALEKLWDMNVPAASALFKSRKGDHNWLLIDETKPEDMRYVQPTSMEKPFKADCTGLGFMLIRKEALDKMKLPFFEPFLHLHDNIDRTFCRKIKDAGFDLMINPQVRLGHKCSEMVY